jgi:hypothetical protein
MRLDFMNVENVDELKSWAFVIYFMIMLHRYMTGAFWIFSFVFGLRYTGYTGLDGFGSELHLISLLAAMHEDFIWCASMLSLHIVTPARY